jgi:ABC-type molybdate transport system permease subunit
MRGVAAGSSLIFARSLGEFGATIVVAKEGVMAKEGVRSKH